MLRAFFLRLEAKTFVSTGGIATMIALKVTNMIRNAARSRAPRAVVCGRNQLTPAAQPAGLAPGSKHCLEPKRLRCSKHDDLDLVTGLLAA